MAVAAFLNALGALDCSSIVPPRGTDYRYEARKLQYSWWCAMPVAYLPVCWLISSVAVVTREYLIHLMQWKCSALGLWTTVDCLLIWDSALWFLASLYSPIVDATLIATPSRWKRNPCFPGDGKSRWELCNSVKVNHRGDYWLANLTIL